jgi:hypothetical protein
VSFDDPANKQTAVRFGAAGDYVLSLTADDGDLQTSDELAVTVSASGPMPGLSFTEITSTAGIAGPAQFGGHGVHFADIDGDGFSDLYITRNDSGDSLMRDLLYRNADGSEFSEEADLRGVESNDTGSHGSVFADFDNDGDFDLYNGAYQQNHLYSNDGNGFFSDVTAVAGLPERSWPTRGVVAFDIEPDGDLDLDGDADLVFPGAAFVYLNDGAGNFTRGPEFTLNDVDDARSVAFADIDNDGDEDFVYAQDDAYNVSIRNDYEGPNQSIRFALIRGNGQAGAFGARIFVYRAGELDDPAALISWREVRSQDGYLSQSDPAVTIGTGDREKVDVRVVFPNGGSTTIRDLATAQSIAIRE